LIVGSKAVSLTLKRPRGGHHQKGRRPFGQPKERLVAMRRALSGSMPSVPPTHNVSGLGRAKRRTWHLAPIGRLLHVYRSPIGAFFLLKPELVEPAPQSYRMCVRRRSESSIARHCFRPRSTLPNLIGAFFVPDDRPLVSGPQQFWNISSKLFSALDARCIKQCLSEGARAERGPDFQMAWGQWKSGPLLPPPQREQPKLSFIAPSRPQLLAGATLV
jgi:hypothetical protein